MAETERPTTGRYRLAHWLEKPHGAPDGVPPYDKYMYKDGESFASIGRMISMPWRRIIPTELQVFNFGTSGSTKVLNYYLHRYCGCTETDESDKKYIFKSTDANPFIWVPRPVRNPAAGRHRSPGRSDVGHVAMDELDDKKHTNTLVVKPEYAVTLELGDIDALFGDIGSSANPGRTTSVRQRLQALGYLYVPLGNPRHGKRLRIANRVWNHYKKIHTKPNQSDRTNTEALAILKRQIQRNILSVYEGDTSPIPGQPLDGRLPDPEIPEVPASAPQVPDSATQGPDSATEVPDSATQGPDSTTEVPDSAPQGPVRPQQDAVPAEFAAIRLPGGYAATNSMWNGDYYDAQYEYDIGHNRHEIEDTILEGNEFLHKIPIVATVHRVHPDGTCEPAEGVSVYFQLLMPHDLPDDCPVKAPDPRDKEMNQSAEWWAWGVDEPEDPAVTDPSLTWPQVQTIARAHKANDDDTARHAAVTAAVRVAVAAVRPRIPDNQQETVRNNANIDVNWYIDEARAARNTEMEIDDAGPKRFVDTFFSNQAADKPIPGPYADQDPQKNNVDKDYCGKRRIPVQGQGAAAGVFEIDTTRTGLHSRRSDKHADYGPMTAAVAVEPTVEDDGAGNNVQRHAYAVRATTNNKGNAGVIFMPSRCGGDAYRFRAYVGPPTLEFDGRDPEGPVTETGTMVVWRNIRLHQYVQIDHGSKAGTHADVKATFRRNKGNPAASGNTGNTDFNRHWDSQSFNTGMPNVDLSEAATGGDRCNKAGHGSFNTSSYRSVDVAPPLSLVQQYRRAYCELIVEQINRQPRVVDYEEYKKVLKVAKQKMADCNWMGRVIDWNALLICECDTNDRTKVGSPYIFTLRLRRDYNRIIAADGYTGGGARLRASDLSNVRLTVGFGGALALIEQFSEKGACGLSIVQSLDGCNWDQVQQGADGDDIVATSGIAGGSRAALLSYPAATYLNFCYAVTCNAAHELGHVLTRPHQHPEPSSDVKAHEVQGQVNTEPVPADPKAGMCTCVMSYFGCYGDYCGRCLLALRGLKAWSGTCADGA